MSKMLRQQAIKEIVSRGSVTNQAVLAEELKNFGFIVTQATLSRDIAELDLVKSKDGYLRPEDAGSGLHQLPDSEGTLRRFVTKVNASGNMLVIRTSPGSAGAVAIVLDNELPDKILGNIAGDDTCIAVARTPEDAQACVRTILSMIE